MNRALDLATEAIVAFIDVAENGVNDQTGKTAFELGKYKFDC